TTIGGQSALAKQTNSVTSPQSSTSSPPLAVVPVTTHLSLRRLSASHTRGFATMESRPMIAGYRGARSPRRLALGLVVFLFGYTDTAAAQSRSVDAAMFRGNAAHNGAYAASPGQALAGLQWRFMTDGDVVSSPTVVGEMVFVGSGDAHLYAL